MGSTIRPARGKKRKDLHLEDEPVRARRNLAEDGDGVDDMADSPEPEEQDGR
jgi:hypothetical protein